MRNSAAASGNQGSHKKDLMRRKRLFVALMILGVVVVVATGLALITIQPVSAQCGSQASSCKNCHETQGQMAVNSDGTGWHQSHAFGDFCYICHGGNNTATDKTAAHAGMVAPLSDVQAACAQCHPNDLQARAQVYAAKLGVQVGSPAGPQTGPTATAAPASAEPASTPQAAPPVAAGVTPNAANLTDYVVRYDQNVLHAQPTNWGNIILVGLLILIVLLGAFFINRREHWFSVSFSERKPLDKDLPADVAGIAVQVSQLSPVSRKALARLLDKPAAATQLLSALDRLSTDETSGDKH